MVRSAVVWWRDQRVGLLREDQRRLLNFKYDPQWLSQGGFSVSVSLPTSNGVLEQQAHSFFAGLLPEGQSRLRICRLLGLSPDDDAGLLLAIGGDCAGALSILPEGQSPAEDADLDEQLSEGDFHRLVSNRSAPTSELTRERQRFSLAGAQEKFTIVKDESGFWLPNAGRPSTHLVKLETVPHVCFAEYMATRVALAIGLPAVEMEYCLLPSEDGAQSHTQPYLMLERYDREPASNTKGILRLHQEDMTQALDYPGTLKYEHDGGPSFRDVVTLVRNTVDSPIRAVTSLRDWQIFNVLIGNWDGHAKNLALLYELHSAVPQLAPFYDVVSIEYINKVGGARYAREMAFSIGGESVPERINRRAWQAFAAEMGLPTGPLLSRVREMATALPGLAVEELQRFQAAYGAHQLHDEWLRLVNRRCQWVMQGL